MVAELISNSMSEVMTIFQLSLEVAVKKAVQLYNRLNSPKVVTKVVRIFPEMVTISFSGSLCYDCGGVQEYVDAFAKAFKVFIDYVELTPGKTREISPRIFEADYSVQSR
jgi:hypothetical protein